MWRLTSSALRHPERFCRAVTDTQGGLGMSFRNSCALPWAGWGCWGWHRQGARAGQHPVPPAPCHEQGLGRDSSVGAGQGVDVCPAVEHGSLGHAALCRARGCSATRITRSLSQVEPGLRGHLPCSCPCYVHFFNSLQELDGLLPTKRC